MGVETAISWTDHTFNPWWGCERVSPGCQHCYAEAFAKRTGNAVWGKQAPRRFFGDKHWDEPLKWDRAAEKAGRPALVFCASMADVFEERPDLVEPRGRLFELIERTPHLIWQLLTKRPSAAESRFRLDGWVTNGERADNWEQATWCGPPNVWIGTTVEDQQRADERIPWLLSIPAPIRFLSCEPLLGPVQLDEINPMQQADDHWPLIRQNALTGHVAGPDDIHPWHVDWVICGGESGAGHRPLDVIHALSLRDQCAAAGVPFFFKQHGGRTPTAGGDLLDGRQHKEFPDRRSCPLPLHDPAARPASPSRGGQHRTTNPKETTP